MTYKMSQIQLKKLKTDNIQLLVSRGAIMHPVLQAEFIKRLAQLEHIKMFCPLPSIILQRYADELKLKVG
jgi:hypothetical protein